MVAFTQNDSRIRKLSIECRYTKKDVLYMSYGFTEARARVSLARLTTGRHMEPDEFLGKDFNDLLMVVKSGKENENNYEKFQDRMVRPHLSPLDRLHDGFPWLRPLLRPQAQPALAPGRELGQGRASLRTGTDYWKQPLKWNEEAAYADLNHSFERDGLGKNLGPYQRPRVFCASMADWLDDEVPIEWLADLLKLIYETPNLDWLLLTKRPQNWKPRLEAVGKYLQRVDPTVDFVWWWQHWIIERTVPANIYIGTSVEDQQRADERIPELLQIPANVWFLSCEPLLEAVHLRRAANPAHIKGNVQLEGIHWVICGGESGPGARPMHPDWARSLRDQCQAAGVPFLFKQWGEWAPYSRHSADLQQRCDDLRKFGKKLAGLLLDGREWNEFPTPFIKS